jgi:hypothetical protein
MGTRKRAAVADAYDSERVLNPNQQDLVRAKKKVNGKPKPPLPLDPGLADVLPKFGTSTLSPGATE